MKVVKWIDPTSRHGPRAATFAWHYTTEYTDDGEFMRCTRNPVVNDVINPDEKVIYPSWRKVPISVLLTMPGFGSAMPYLMDDSTGSSAPE